MLMEKDSYDFIKEKIDSYKKQYASLRELDDCYVFSAVAFKCDYYKDPRNTIGESDINNILVDGSGDGGVDVIADIYDDDRTDLVLCQSKFKRETSYEEVSNAVKKMYQFYVDMSSGRYSDKSQKVCRQFLNCNEDVGDESKIVFVFYTSAPRKNIRVRRLEGEFASLTNGDTRCVLRLRFADDIVGDIKESESINPSIESGKIAIDKPDNYLLYQESAIVNVSAMSIKRLYGRYDVSLLSQNLRYHVKGNEIDKAIKETIQEDRQSFWYKNNGITISCDDYEIDGKEVHLKNFSIINGGQTAFNIFKSNDIDDKTEDFFLPCRIIKNVGVTEEQKSRFVLEVAKAVNSQKAIKAIDLKANAPEQSRFKLAMRNCNVFYVTKRGEKPGAKYQAPYLNADLAKIGKLFLCGVFQQPATSRNRPSELYRERYYNPMFVDDDQRTPYKAKIASDLLYIDYFFSHSYIAKRREKSLGGESDIRFASNSRTICVAYAALLFRIYQNNLDVREVSRNFEHKDIDAIYDQMRNLGELKSLLPSGLDKGTDRLDGILTKMFDAIIARGYAQYRITMRYNESLNETNFLKKDDNYDAIIFDNASDLLDVSRYIPDVL